MMSTQQPVVHFCAMSSKTSSKLPQLHLDTIDFLLAIWSVDGGSQQPDCFKSCQLRQSSFWFHGWVAHPVCNGINKIKSAKS